MAERSAEAQALGHSRGGLSTNVLVSTANEDTALVVDAVPGQPGDAPLLVPLLEWSLERVPTVDEVVADKAFDGDDLRCQWLEPAVNPNIPLKANRNPDQRAWDAEGYHGRNRVGRLFGKAK